MNWDDWGSHARCRCDCSLCVEGVDKGEESPAHIPWAWFYPDRGKSAKPAYKLCNTCPARMYCLATAISRREMYGIWGGLMWPQRSRIARTIREMYGDNIIGKKKEVYRVLEEFDRLGLIVWNEGNEAGTQPSS